MVVFILHHVHELEDQEDEVKLIGVYSSDEIAKQAVERMKVLPGFCDAQDGFCIDAYTVDEDNWIEGYITLYE